MNNQHNHSHTQAHTSTIAVEEHCANYGNVFVGTCKLEHNATCKTNSSKPIRIEINSQFNDSNLPRALVVGAADVVAMVAAGDSDKVVFVLDTGCSQHIYNGKRESMINFTHKIQRISTANDKGGLSALGVGDLPVVLTDDLDAEQSVVLEEVLWAPNATASMLSISQSVVNGCTQGADEEGAWIRLPAPLLSYILAESQGGLYLIRAVLQIVSAEVISLTTHTKTDTSVEMAKADINKLALQVHASFGHINWTAVKQRLTQGGDEQVGGLTPALVDLLLAIKTLFCAACDASKKTQLSLPKFIEHPPTWPWELVQADNSGPRF